MNSNSYFKHIFPVVKDKLLENKIDGLTLQRYIQWIHYFYHTHFLDNSFSEEYCEYNGLVYGNQELDEFDELYRYIKETDSYIRSLSDYYILLEPIASTITIPKPMLFMSELSRYPIKEWISILRQCIDFQVYYIKALEDPSVLEEDVATCIFFTWDVEKDLKKIEPLLHFFRRQLVYF